jgi:hypothetical protein
MVFDGKASHDKYQDAPAPQAVHRGEPEELKKVRVFDSLVDAVK